MALVTGVQHLCAFNIVTPLIYHLLSNVWKALYTISASIFVDVPYWQHYSTDKLISCVVPGPSQWFFHFGEEIVITWTHIRWVRGMFQNLPLPATQKVRDSTSGVTPCMLWRMMGFVFSCVHMIMVGQAAQAARGLTTGWTARVRSWVSEGWRFFFTPLCPDLSWGPLSLL